jgi:hypothetical protein
MKAKDVRLLIEQGEYKKALSGAKDFHIGVTREQRSVMARGYECMIHPDFYRQIGKNPDECIQAGIAVMRAVMTPAEKEEAVEKRAV